MTYDETICNTCKNNIIKNEMKIIKCEEAHESLMRFKGEVVSQGNNFLNVSSNKEKQLIDLQIKTINCKTVRLYIEGMNRVLDRIGMHYVKGTYEWLVAHSDERMNSYVQKINEYERKNMVLENRVNYLTEKIRIDAMNKIVSSDL